MFNLHLFCEIFHILKWKNAYIYIKYLNALRIVMIFFKYTCIFLSDGRAGYTNACLCMGTHRQPLLQNRIMDLHETW